MRKRVVPRLVVHPDWVRHTPEVRSFHRVRRFVRKWIVWWKQRRALKHGEW